MNINTLRKSIEFITLYLELNSIPSIGDLPDGFNVIPDNVKFSGNVDSNFIAICGRVNDPLKLSKHDCAILGFTLVEDGTLEATLLNECISYIKYGDTVDECTKYEGTTSNMTDFKGQFVLVCEYEDSVRRSNAFNYELFTVS